jgi:tetratricopeptide (TPR) repeat protein
MNLDTPEPYVQYRFKQPNDAGLNYHRLYLTRTANRKVIAHDLYTITTGERASETLHRAWIQAADQFLRQKQGAQQLAGPLNPSMETMAMCVDLVNQSKFQEALAMFRQAPDSVRKEKILLILALVAAEKISEEDYRDVVEQFRKYYPNDPAADFLSIDSFVQQQSYGDALNGVDRTIQNLGTDGALLAVRSKILFLQEQYPEALQEARRAIAAEPDLSSGYAVLLDAALATRDHPETLNALSTLQKKFAVKFGDLTEVPEYAEFVKSPEYQKWLESVPVQE